MIRLLIFGDIVARAGREAIKLRLQALQEEHKPDLTVANVENLAHGKGITPQTIQELEGLGIQMMTSGNHIWAKREGRAVLDVPEPTVIRPANYPDPCPGHGHTTVQIGAYSVLFINLLGRVFFREDVEDPFAAFDGILQSYQQEPPALTIVDFHAEATSEKIAFSHFVDGRASLVYGTHTHVPTADARILPGGTAAITDIGMTGAHNSVLGVEKNVIIEKFQTQRPAAHTPAEGPPYELTAILVDLNPTTSKAESIQHIREIIEE